MTRHWWQFLVAVWLVLWAVWLVLWASGVVVICLAVKAAWEM